MNELLNERIHRIGKTHEKRANVRRKINDMSRQQRNEELALVREFEHKRRQIRNRYEEKYRAEFERIEQLTRETEEIHAAMNVLGRQLGIPQNRMLNYIGSRHQHVQALNFKPGGNGYLRAHQRFLQGAATMKPIPPIEPSPHRGAAIALKKLSRNQWPNSESGKRRRF
jgi:hypothetical protein